MSSSVFHLNFGKLFVFYFLESAMGVKVNAQEKPGLEYVQAIARLVVKIHEKVLQNIFFNFRPIPECLVSQLIGC